MRRAARLTLCALLLGVLSACTSSGEPPTEPPLASSASLQTLSFAALDGRIDVLVADEVVRLAEREEIDLQASISEALTRIDEQLSLPRTQLIVKADATRAIPEIGVGGFADPRSGVVHVYLDPGYRESTAALGAIPVTLAHEMHHAARILQGPGYGRTLLEALVSEGLADAFSLEVYPDMRPSDVPWLHALSDVEEKGLWTDALPLLDSRRFGHARWFFGTGDIPRWAGYTLGFHLVSGYLESSGRTAADSVHTAADRIKTASPYRRRG